MKYGPITANNLKNFNTGIESMPLEIIKALLIIKKAAALSNGKLKEISYTESNNIVKCINKILNLTDNQLNKLFPLKVWQTGSGTQTNMNINEVISLSSDLKLHPNDIINKGQSSNDVFPTAINIACAIKIKEELLPAITSLKKEIKNKQKKFKKIIKVGRTHMMDATNLTLGDEFSAFYYQIELAEFQIKFQYKQILSLALGGTAVGTGVNSHPLFAKYAIKEISRLTKINFTEKRNKFAGLSTHDDLTYLSGALKGFSSSLYKILSDLRLLSSGPRAGLYELRFKGNEAGSSIMPGKINPTQIESLTMICNQVMANDQCISFSNSQGQLQLNTYKPLIAYNLLQSIHLLSGGLNSFNHLFIKGLSANTKQINRYIEKSLMISTILTPKFGYELMSKITKDALDNDTSVKEEMIKKRLLTEQEYEKLITVPLKKK